MDILDNLGGNGTRPEPNLEGVNFDCQECRELVSEAYYDRRKSKITYWCSKGHESTLEEVNLDI